MDSEFDSSRIPDHVMHDAVRITLSDRNLSGGTGLVPYNFRCPICGDSKTNPHKKRGFILFNDGAWVYTCHNECGTMGFIHFLKIYHPSVYRDVIFHAFDRSYQNKKVPEKKNILHNFKGNKEYKFKDGELLSILDQHPVCKQAVDLCKSRHIRHIVYSKWFVCIRDDKFRDRDANGRLIYNEKGVPIGNEYGNRIIIPYYRYGGTWKQFDARDLAEVSWMRYRNLEGAEREMYNVDFLNVNEPFFLFEGAIDSTFVRNSVAFGGTKHLLSFLEQHPEIRKNAHLGTVIWDNDDAGYDEMPVTTRLGFNWFDWSEVTVHPEYKFKSDGSLRVIKDMNDAVLYSDCFELDVNGFVKISSLKKYIRSAKGAEIKLRLLYGNRDKMRQERVKKRFDEMKKNREKNEIIPYF